MRIARLGETFGQAAAVTRLPMLHRLGRTISALAVASLTLTSQASAQPAIYDTERVVPFSGTECVGARGRACTSVSSRRTWIEADTSGAIELACTEGYPYVVGWDARHHEHITLVVMAAGPEHGLPQRVKIGARNNADVRGMASITVGCSRRPFAGGPFMTSKRSIPSKHPNIQP